MKKLALVAVLALVACKKEAAAPAGGSAAGSSAGASAGSSAAASAEIADDAAYLARGAAVIERVTATLRAAGTQCDKLAADISAFSSEASAELKALKAYEVAHPDAKQKLEAGMQEKTKAFQEAATASMSACSSNEKVMAAFKQLTNT